MPSVESSLCASLKEAVSINEKVYDGILLVSHSSQALRDHAPLKELAQAVESYVKLNAAAENSSTLIAVGKDVVPSGRLVYAGTGPVTRDQDDVRRFANAARKGMKIALMAGMRSILVITVPHKDYPHAELVAALNSLHEVYVPLNVREEESVKKADIVGFLGLKYVTKDLVKLIRAYDAAFTVTRDIGDSDPQRMCPANVVAYLSKAFGSSIKVWVIDEQADIKREFPLISAVSRAASVVPEHQPRLIWLEYTPPGPIDETVMLVGKGVTIDTGGADVKTNGAMFGMSRDKYGSAIVAGMFKAAEILQPKAVKMIGCMAMVRNSIGSRSYTCDEIIRSRSGKKIAIYNTDAEGRLIMLDPLTRMREVALREKNPRLFTVATLTGHAVVSYGYMTAAMENGPAHTLHVAERIQERGDTFGQPVEISRLCSEDYAFHEAECESADLRQGNTLPSVKTIRGHQTPATFLIQGSRLDEHGSDSELPIAYTHLDIGDAMGAFPHVSFPNPLVALIATYIVPRI